MKKDKLIIIILLFVTYHSHGQNLKKGSIVTLQKDTIKGWIDYKYTKKTPTSISFFTKKTTKAQLFDVNTILGFQVMNDNNQLEIYEAATVTIDTISNNGTSLDNSSKMRTKEEKAFLQVLASGGIDLLFLKDIRYKEHFFYRTENEEIILLFYKIYKPNLGKRVALEQYKTQLKQLLKNCNTITSRMIDKTPYKKANLTLLISQYNECTDPNIANYAFKSEPLKSSFSVVGGAFLYQVNFSEGSSIFTTNPIINSVIPRTINFYGGIGWNIVLPNTKGKMAFYNEVSYNYYKSTGAYIIGTDTTRIINIKMQYIKLNSLLRYQLWKNKTFSQDAQIGFSSGFLLSNEFSKTLTRNTPPKPEDTSDILTDKQFKKFLPALLVGTSFSWNDQLSLHLRYELTPGFTQTNTLSSHEQSLFLLIGYTF